MKPPFSHGFSYGFPIKNVDFPIFLWVFSLVSNDFPMGLPMENSPGPPLRSGMDRRRPAAAKAAAAWWRTLLEMAGVMGFSCWFTLIYWWFHGISWWYVHGDFMKFYGISWWYADFMGIQERFNEDMICKQAIICKKHVDHNCHSSGDNGLTYGWFLRKKQN